VNEVRIRFYATMREKAGQEEISCEASRLKDIISYLKKNYDREFNRNLRSCHIFVNQDNAAHLNGPSTRLRKGDVIHILPPTGGG